MCIFAEQKVTEGSRTLLVTEPTCNLNRVGTFLCRLLQHTTKSTACLCYCRLHSSEVAVFWWEYLKSCFTVLGPSQCVDVDFQAIHVIS